MKQQEKEQIEEVLFWILIVILTILSWYLPPGPVPVPGEIVV